MIYHYITRDPETMKDLIFEVVVTECGRLAAVFGPSKPPQVFSCTKSELAERRSLGIPTPEAEARQVVKAATLAMKAAQQAKREESAAALARRDVIAAHTAGTQHLPKLGPAAPAEPAASAEE